MGLKALKNLLALDLSLCGSKLYSRLLPSYFCFLGVGTFRPLPVIARGTVQRVIFARDVLGTVSP